MNKLLVIILSLMLITTGTISTAAASGSNNEIKAMLSPINDYLLHRYDCISNLTYTEFEQNQKTNKGRDFAAIESEMLCAEIAALSSIPHDMTYADYDLIVEYSNPITQNSNASINASVICRFSYNETPEIDSEYGIMYRFDLSRTPANTWEIVDRSYPTLFDRAFWGCDTPSLESAIERRQAVQTRITNGYVDNQEYFSVEPTPNSNGLFFR